MSSNKRNKNVNLVSTEDVYLSELSPEERAKREKEAKDQADEDVRHVMSTKSGRRFVWLLLNEAGIFRQSFTGNSETFFREGERNIGLKYQERVRRLCPKAYIEMQAENLKTNER